MRLVIYLNKKKKPQPYTRGCTERQHIGRRGLASHRCTSIHVAGRHNQAGERGWIDKMVCRAESPRILDARPGDAAHEFSLQSSSWVRRRPVDAISMAAAPIMWCTSSTGGAYQRGTGVRPADWPRNQGTVVPYCVQGLNFPVGPTSRCAT